MSMPDVSRADVVLIGFGETAPEQVLSLVAAAVKDHGHRSIVPVRSPSIEHVLSQSRFRAPLRDASPGTPAGTLVVCCLPPSPEEAAYVRSQLPPPGDAPPVGGARVVCFDGRRGFVGAQDATGAGLAPLLLRRDAFFAEWLARHALDALEEPDGPARVNQPDGPAENLLSTERLERILHEFKKRAVSEWNAVPKPFTVQDLEKYTCCLQTANRAMESYMADLEKRAYYMAEIRQLTLDINALKARNSQGWSQ